MKPQPYHQSTFMLSAALVKQLPEDTGYEVAFAGRSNAGKSSALNTITRQRNLAKTSKTPGRTQLINLFKLDEHRRLVDLPGYGYAKVPLETRNRWQRTLGHYLETRECLKGLILLMDIRHPLQELDKQLLTWAMVGELPVHILLTKADKLNRSPALQTMSKVKQALVPYGENMTVQLFSSITREGLDEVYATLNAWYEY
jgi:GTP-binding protein